MNYDALRELVRKDLRIFRNDRRSVILSFAVPLVLASFMGLLTGGRRGKVEISRVKVAVVDHDRSELSREIFQNLAQDKNLEVSSLDLAAARVQLQKGKIPVAVVLPEKFGERSSRAFFRPVEKPEVVLLFDPSHSSELAMVHGILTQHVMQAVSKHIFATESGVQVSEEALQGVERSSNLSADDRQKLQDLLKSTINWQRAQNAKPAAERASSQSGFGLSLPYEAREEQVTSGQDVAYNGYAHSFAGMGVQFVLFSAIEAAVKLLTERQRGLWRRLRAAPLSRNTLLVSRAISGALIALLILLVLFGFGMAVFGIRIEGSVVGFFLVCLAFALMSSSLGLCIASLGKTPEAARGISIFVVLVMVMLGGAWFPSFLFPPFLQKLTLAIPTRWAVDGLDGMTWRGLGLESAATSAGVLLAFAAAFVVLAVNRFHWESD